MARARIGDIEGRDAVAAWRAGEASGSSVERATLALAVRYTLQVLAEVHPGGSVEVRVPPFGAVQCVEGPRHTRGTPPNVIETDAATWLSLATGAFAWDEARATGRVHASGQRADLTGRVPVIDLR
ncbi:sterol carrier family protein [Agromyces larvae]|uniref:Sterol carrier family protein n=1 Tax=Agromyces larvae TaxID=2929802 RepID=A0ABY4BVT7_9MICO|nr:sterol carrier family protein [Agromyces larvae]UOE43014.1 sterol carrier family protein [Agromyces larvae]